MQNFNCTKTDTCQNQNIPDTLLLFEAEVKENTPNVHQLSCWRLLTTCKVETYEEAISIIGSYKQRWHIEQLFRLLKK